MKNVMQVLYLGKSNANNPFEKEELRESYYAATLLEEELKKSGIYMFFAMHVFEIERLLEKTEFAMLICNLSDADDDYIALLRKLKKEKRHMKMVLLGTDITKEDVQLAEELNCVCILDMKTMNMDSFFYLIRSIFRDSKLEYVKNQKNVYADIDFLYETFYRNVLLSERLFDENEQIEKGRELGISLEIDDLYVPVLFQLAKSSRLMETQEKVIAIDLFHKNQNHLKTQERYHIVVDSPESFILLFHQEKASYKSLAKELEDFVDFCLTEDIRWRCYIGKQRKLADVRKEYLILDEIEENNFVAENSFIVQPDEVIEKGIPIIESKDWTKYFVEDKGYRIKADIVAFLEEQTAKKEINVVVMRSLVHRLSLSFYTSLERRNHPIDDLLADSDYLKIHGAAMNSPEHLWKYFSYLDEYNTELIQKLQKQNFLSTRIVQYVAEHIEEELSREEIAAEFAMSKDYVSHVFKKEYGTSLISFINQQKIQRAQEYLMQGKLSVGEIAGRLGIDNFSYFTRIFKKEVGVSPQQYRQNYMKNKKK